VIDTLDINAVLGFALGYLIAALVRYMQRSRFWRHVTERARQYLADPSVPVDDPGRAAEQALVDEQRERVDAVARTLAPAPPVNVPRVRTLRGVTPPDKPQE
jgi:hypothetical protein